MCKLQSLSACPNDSWVTLNVLKFDKHLLFSVRCTKFRKHLCKGDNTSSQAYIGDDFSTIIIARVIFTSLKRPYWKKVVLKKHKEKEAVKLGKS